MRHALLPAIALFLTALSATSARADVATTPMDLGTLGGTWSYPFGISDDGSVVVGASYMTGNSVAHAFRWTQSAGMVDLGTLGGTNSNAYGVSADGSVVVGNARNASAKDRAFRWTQAGGMVDLGTFGGTSSYAYGVSADGSVVVGNSYTTGDSAYHAFCWTQAGMVDLGTLGGTNSSARGASADGSVVVGNSYMTGNSVAHAFRWTQSAGMVDLGTLGGTNSAARGASADGSVVVGSASNVSNQSHAFRWTQSAGMKDLNALLADAGVNMAGITLLRAYGISASGKYIMGYGDFGDGNDRPFLVCYDPDNGCVGLTTGGLQADSAQRLSDARASVVAQSRATANELLGMAQPVEKGSYVRAGAMFGSAMAYISGQASVGGLTALGGLGWGAQDYGQVEQSNALTFAGALRYAFPSPFNGKFSSLRPYAELGGWATPEETLTFSRTYANGSGTSTGQGSAEASSFAAYARGGLIWDVSPKDKLVGYGEFGRQYLSVSSYVETYGPRNPFPAEVNGGLLSMNVAKIGGQWTHEVGNAFLSFDGNAMPVSLTLAGAAARSFNTHMGLSATLAGAGAVTTSSRSDTWGEFGARASAQVTKNISFGLDVSAISGADPVGTSFHGGASLSFGF